MPGGEFTDARKTLDDLLVDEGMDGEEVLRDLLRVGRSRYSGGDLAELHVLAGDVEFDLTQGNSDRIQLGRLLAEQGGSFSTRGDGYRVCLSPTPWNEPASCSGPY